MADMHHQIRIAAPVEDVYSALTHGSGIRRWWTGNCLAEPRIGSMAELGFSSGQVVFRMRVDELDPNEKVVWTCLGDVDEWVGTRLTWELVPVDDSTELRFTHAYWRSIAGSYPLCNSTWGALMFRLRDYLEGRNPGPLFLD